MPTIEQRRGSRCKKGLKQQQQQQQQEQRKDEDVSEMGRLHTHSPTPTTRTRTHPQALTHTHSPTRTHTPTIGKRGMKKRKLSKKKFFLSFRNVFQSSPAPYLLFLSFTSEKSSDLSRTYAQVSSAAGRAAAAAADGLVAKVSEDWCK